MRDNKFDLITIFLIILIFFLPFFLSPQILTTKENDLGMFYMPLFEFVRSSFYENKQIPLWRSEQLMGETLIGNPASTILYPLNLIFLLPLDFAVVFYLFAHFLLSGIFTFFLARSFNLSSSSSFAAAIIYSFSTKALAHFSAGHIIMIASFAYFPLVFLSIRKLILSKPVGIQPLITKGQLLWVIAGSVALTFIYITYPTIFYYSSIFIALYLFYKFAFHLKKERQKIAQRIISWLVPFIVLLLVTLGLTSMAFLPHLEFGTLSTRSQLTLEDVAIPFWNFNRFLVALLFPYLSFGNIDHESLLYLGVVPILFSIFGFFHLNKIQKITLIVFAVVALLFAAGLSTPIFKLAYDYLPLLKYSRVTTRFWFAVSLTVALLAAYGLEKIRKPSITYLAVFLFLVEAIFIAHQKILQTPDLQFTNESLYQFLARDKELFRVYCTTTCFDPQQISKYQIQVLHGYNPIQHADFIDFLQKAGNYQYKQFAVIFPPYQVWQTDNPPTPNSEILGLASVKYLASTYPIANDNLSIIDKFDKVYLYRNKNFKPRIYFEDSNDVVKIETYLPNEISLSFANSDKFRNLIISENFYPGWFAYLEGQKFNVQKHNAVFRKVTVPPNTQSQVLKYQPESFKLGKTITFSTVAFLILWYIRCHPNGQSRDP